MKCLRTYISILLILQSGLAVAQTVPDFAVTDSWGNTHRLYEDYLQHGKTVVIKVFFVSCPPCNAIAPHLEPLYQSWGGGQADVQFIELSVRQTDNNAMINSYKLSHGTSFPAVGGQGGSVSAVQPYTNGTLGLYTGTPLFAVIAPDGTIQYDVSGFNIQGTINAIDAAIAATGATGLQTGGKTFHPISPVRLKSNLVQDDLLVEISDKMEDLQISVVNMLGQRHISANFAAMSGEVIRLHVEKLPAGIWICRITSEINRSVASYLFVKQ